MSSKLKIWHVVGFIFSVSISMNTYAQTIQLKGNYFIRSSADFMPTDNNKLGVLRAESTFRVINSKPLRNGAEALEIEIISSADKSNVKPSPTGHLFIYKKKDNEHFFNPSITEGNTAINSSSSCADCNSAIAQKEKISSANLKDLNNTAEGIVAQDNKAPKEKKETAEKPIPTVPQVRAGSLNDKIKNYSESPEVENMISWAMKNKTPKSERLCYRKVKEAIATQCGPDKENYRCRNAFAPKGGRLGPGNNLMSKVSTEMADQAALSAKDRLKEHGFLNLLEIEPYKTQMKSPSQAPKGAVLVYSSGIPCGRNPDCGHIEIKTDVEGRPGYVSDFYAENPINDPRNRRGSKYKLVGIMIKPKE